MKKAFAIGRVTKDVELETRKIGNSNEEVSVVNFNIAENTYKATAKRGQDGKRIYDKTTTYFKVTVWRDKAVNLAPYLKRGKRLYVEGDFELEKWMSRDGVVHPLIHFTSPSIELLDDAKTAAEEPPAETAPDDPVEDVDGLPFD